MLDKKTRSRVERGQFFAAMVWVICLTNTAFAAQKPEQNTALYSALSMGTAWAITPRHLVTNYHVVKDTQNLRIVLAGQKEIPVKLLLQDENADLAILQVADNNFQLKPLPLTLTRPRLGTMVFTIGFPHPNLLGTNPKLTSGLISATSGIADDPRTLQVSVPVQSGNSGGPLLNMHGEVVGVITSKLNAQQVFEYTGDIPQNVTYAIKINYLSQLLSNLETSERVAAGGEKNEQPLDVLAEKSIGSVVMIAGDNDNKYKQSLHAGLFATHKENDTPHAEDTFVVFAYAEPGNYDLQENIKGSASIPAYSKNILKVLRDQILSYQTTNIKFVSDSGYSAKSTYYNLEQQQYRKQLCEKHMASKLIAGISEKAPGAHFRSVAYRLIDCTSYNELKKEYIIRRDEVNDRFGYEMALHSTFRDFLLKIPPHLNWSHN